MQSTHAIHLAIRAIVLLLFLVVSLCVFSVPAQAHASTTTLFERLSATLGVDAVTEAWQTLFGRTATLQGLAQVGALGNSTIYVSPREVELEEGETVELQVRIDPGTNDDLTAVSLDMTFDPQIVSVESINSEDSPFTVTLLAPEVNNGSGDASVTLGVPAKNPPVPITRDALVVTIELRALDDIDGSPVAFTEASVAAAVGQSGNVVKTRTPSSTVQRTYSGSTSSGDGASGDSGTTQGGPAAPSSGTGTATSRCTGTGQLVQFVNLLLASGFIHEEKAARACAALSSAEAGTAANTPEGVVRFERPLKLGDNNNDVLELQRFLNVQGFRVHESGDGSPGKETTYFGTRTQQAVKAFQSAYASEILAPVNLTEPSGYWGPSSIKKANALLSV